MNEAVSPGALSTLFTDARTHNGWREPPSAMRRYGDLCPDEMGPTSANCSPARIVFIRTAEGKERLRPALSSGNLQNPDRARHRYRRLGRVNFMNGYHSCFLTAMPAVGLPPVLNLPKKQRFATVPCRRPI